MPPELKKLIRVGGALVLVAAGYYAYMVLLGPGVANHPPGHTPAEIGEVFGLLNLLLFASLYGRAGVRLWLKNTGTQPIPGFAGLDLRLLLERLRAVLERYHAVAGLLVMASILVHAWLMTGYQTNLLLYAVLALAAWQGGSGPFLRLRHTPATLKRQLYLVHAQLYSGLAILIFAFFGHLLHAGD